MNTTKADDWIVQVSSAERAAGRLSIANEHAARASLKTNGATLLRGALAAEMVDALHGAFQTQWGGFSDAQMLERSKQPAPNPVLCVGEGRYEILIRMSGAFGDPNLFANNLLCNLLAGALDRRMKLSGLTAVISYPGAKVQHIHSDLHALFDEPGLGAALPHYAINVAVPLIDVDAITGPTAIWLGSHLWEANRSPRPEESVSVDFLRGDCVLIDYRTLHAGLPNNSAIARPILYMVYARTWFFDEANHRARPSLDMAVEDFVKLAPHVRELVARAFSQRMRARYIAAADGPEN
jgi:hypothetical protein